MRQIRHTTASRHSWRHISPQVQLAMSQAHSTDQSKYPATPLVPPASEQRENHPRKRHVTAAGAIACRRRASATSRRSKPAGSTDQFGGAASRRCRRQPVAAATVIHCGRVQQDWGPGVEAKARQRRRSRWQVEDDLPGQTLDMWGVAGWWEPCDVSSCHVSRGTEYDGMIKTAFVRWSRMRNDHVAWTLGSRRSSQHNQQSYSCGLWAIA